MAYIGKTPTQAVRNRYHFTATGGETSITSTEISNFAFEDGALVDVMLNGLTLIGDGNDYNTTTANTIGGLSALAANDVIEIVVYEPFSVFSGNVNGDFNINGNLKLSDTAITATAAEINHLDGVTSNIQTQINGISSEVVDDTTPQLGGTLDTNGNVINDASGVDLQYNGTTRLSTTSGGVEVTGDLRVGDTGNGSFKAVSGNYGSIEIDGGAHGGYEGYSIGGRAVFMHNNASSTGLYNDVDNEWLINCAHNGATHLYYNGVNKFQTTSSGAQVNGNLNVTGSIVGAGKVLQVVQDVESNAQSYTGTGESTILSATITPSSTSSKILILCTTHINSIHGYRYAYGKLYRGSSNVFNGNSSGNRTPVTVGHTGNSDGHDRYQLHDQSFQVLDSPNTTSATTYYVKMGNSYYNTTVYNNRTSIDANAGYSQRGASSLILMEIAG